MRKPAIVACLLLLAGGAFSREATITPADDLHILRYGATPTLLDAQPDCAVGSADFGHIQGYYASWWVGSEDYAFLIHPATEGCACSEGFVISAVHMLLGLYTDTNLQVQGALYTAVNGGFGYLVPGVELYAGPVQTITGITGHNYYDVAAPITEATSTCLPANASYFLVFRFLDNGAPAVDLPVDSTPTSCANYNEWGTGWEELVDSYGFQGDLFIWGDAACCVDGVPNETSNWGELKALFR